MGNKERKVCYSAVYPRCVARSPRELDAAEFEVELPADWVVGDDALPTSLEGKQHFLGINRIEEERTGHMGEPKVVDTISLFNHVLRDLGGPRDLAHFFQGLRTEEPLRAFMSDI